MFSVFPESQLDDPARLADNLGSFWANLFSKPEQVTSLLKARAKLDKQIDSTFNTLMSSMSRKKLPPLRRKLWYPITIDTALRGHTDYDIAHFGEAITFGTEASYGESVKRMYTAYPVSPQIIRLPYLANRFSSASVTLTENVDYILERGYILFAQDPATIPGVIVDENGLATLWAYGSLWDEDDMYIQYGYVLSLKGKSSKEYNTLINSLYDSLVGGCTVKTVEEALSAVCDAPLCRTDGEVVKSTFVANDFRWVLTDKNVYRCAKEATIAVEAKQVLSLGDALTDAFELFELNHGVTPDAIRALALDRGFVQGQNQVDLVFENKTVPTVVSTDEDGYTKLEFELKGNPGDVEEFWNYVHAQGKAQGKTLAMYLDTRPKPEGQPSALALPSTINPLAFLVANCFRYGIFIVKLTPNSFGPYSLGMAYMSVLRRLVPPHVGFIVFTELAQVDAPIIMDGSDQTGPGYSAEDVSPYLGLYSSDSIATESIGEDIRVVLIRGRCL